MAIGRDRSERMATASTGMLSGVLIEPPGGLDPRPNEDPQQSSPASLDGEPTMCVTIHLDGKWMMYGNAKRWRRGS
jgi:hypothetical protein